MCLNGLDSTPRILALECSIEIKHLDELVARVRGLAHQQTQIDECEHDISNVGRAAHAPVLEDEARHDAKAVEREVAAGQGELAPRDVPPFIEALLTEFEGGEHEEIRALVEPRLPEPDAVHDAVSKRQFCHNLPRYASQPVQRNGG